MWRAVVLLDLRWKWSASTHDLQSVIDQDLCLFPSKSMIEYSFLQLYGILIQRGFIQVIRGDDLIFQVSLT